MQKFLTVSKTPICAGDLLRSNGAGNRLMQVMQLNGDQATLISAGRVSAGKHTPAERAHVIHGSVRDHMVLVEGGSTIQVYTKVESAVPLEGLPIMQDVATLHLSPWEIDSLRMLLDRYLALDEGSELDDENGPDTLALVNIRRMLGG